VSSQPFISQLEIILSSGLTDRWIYLLIYWFTSPRRPLYTYTSAKTISPNSAGTHECVCTVCI
jgi:hypothetical protein